MGDWGYVFRLLVITKLFICLFEQIQSLQECTTKKIFEQHAIRCHRATRIEKCIQSLTEVLGESIPRRELIRVTLAANCDVNRALNFYFSWQSQEPP